MPGSRGTLPILFAGLMLLLLALYPLSNGNVEGATELATFAALPLGVFSLLFVLDVGIEKAFKWVFDS